MKYDITDGVAYGSGKNKGKQVKRERYSNMIGYDFGGYVYEGAAYDTSGRQYIFRNNETGTIWVTDYKGFREHIDKFDFPKRKLR